MSSNFKFEFWYPNSIHGSHRSEVERFFNDIVASPIPFNAHADAYCLVLVRSKKGDLIGAIAVQPEAPSHLDGSKDLSNGYNVEINFIAVAPTHRGKGLARDLIRKGLRIVIENMRSVQGYPEYINGICTPDQTEFYRKLGFQVSNPGVPLPEELTPYVPELADSYYTCSFWRVWDESALSWSRRLD